MTTTLRDIASPQVVLDTVTRIKKGRGRLANWFGFIGDRQDRETGAIIGPNTKTVPTRSGEYAIYDRTRTLMLGRAPGTGPGTTQPNPYGRVPYTVARFHEKIPLIAEELGQLATVMGPNTVIDQNGQNYVAQQIGTLAERGNNTIELMTWGMTRGLFYLKNVGDNWIPVLTAPSAGTGSITVDMRIPAGNKGQLDMLGGGALIGTSWDNAAAPILANLGAIDAAMERLTGDTITDIWLSSATWNYILANTQVINRGGTANTVFASYERVTETGYGRESTMGGASRTSKPGFAAVLRGYPNVVWHITNEVLVIDGGTDPSYAAGSGTLGQAVPDGYILGMPPVDSDWVDLLMCGELISEQPGQPAVKRNGWYFWTEYCTQPTGMELITLLNAIPRLKRPKAMIYAQVVFP